MFQNKNESWPNYSYREIDIVKKVLKSPNLYL